MTLTANTHPYVNVTQNEDFEFGYFYANSLDRYRIFLKDKVSGISKSRLTLQQLMVDEVYNSHHGEQSDLLTIKKNYSKSYIKSLQELFGGKLAPDEVYRLIFGVEYNSKDFYKRPLVNSNTIYLSNWECRNKPVAVNGSGQMFSPVR
jgi:hypothetical protein